MIVDAAVAIAGAAVDDEGARVAGVDSDGTPKVTATGVDVGVSVMDETGGTMGTEVEAPAPAPVLSLELAAERRETGDSAVVNGGRGLPEKLTPWAIGSA